jgi:hypothetical protein
MSSESSLPEIEHPVETDYGLRRRALQNAVREQTATTGSLRGSWASQNFHLNKSRSASWSDIDVWGSNAPEPLAKEVAISTVYDTITFRVSVHPYDYQPTLGLTAQKLIAVANMLTNLNANMELRRYNLAKAYLVCSRETPTQGYREVGERLGVSGRLAIRAKIGDHTGDCPEILLAEPLLIETVNILMQPGRPVVDLDSERTRICEQLLHILRNRRLDMDELFQSYIAKKFTRAWSF